MLDFEKIAQDAYHDEMDKIAAAKDIFGLALGKAKGAKALLQVKAAEAAAKAKAINASLGNNFGKKYKAAKEYAKTPATVRADYIRANTKGGPGLSKKTGDLSKLRVLAEANAAGGRRFKRNAIGGAGLSALLGGGGYALSRD